MMRSEVQQSAPPPSRVDRLAAALSLRVPKRMRETEWAAGYGVLGVEFESGDVLALRHFPYGTIGAYSTVWHRTPEGAWRMYFDAPRSDLACPRYFSEALFDSENASIQLNWQGPNTLEVRASRRHMLDLRWSLTLGSSTRTSLLNTMSRLMPSGVATRPTVLNAMTRGADILLGMGGFAATGRSPNGQNFMLQPKWMAPLASSSAQLNGADLGGMVKVGQTRSLGEFVIPRRPLFAVGWAFFDGTKTLAAPAAEIADEDQGELLSKYVCQRLVSRVMEAAHHGTFGGERTFATVMFVDINGFTALAERCEPERVMQVLNRNLAIIVDTIFRYDGAVLKFLGDGVLCAFGVHQRRPDDVQRATMAALEIQANIRAGQGQADQDERVSVAIGLHCGDLVCGNIGHRDRLDFTIIGDTVNVAQRIQSLAEAGETLVSGTIVTAVGDQFMLQDGREASVKGRADPIWVYRLVDTSRAMDSSDIVGRS